MLRLVGFDADRVNFLCLRAEVVPHTSDNLELVRDLQFHHAGVQLLTPLKQAVLAADDDFDR